MNRDLKILVVDDDEQSQKMLGFILRHFGCEVATVSNGQEAVQLVKLRQFDLVFMDIQMPVMDGLEATCRIREWETPGDHLPIIGLTAGFDERAKSWLTLGMDSVLSKPFNTDRLREVIDACADKKEISLRVEQALPEPSLADLPILDFARGLKRFVGDRDHYFELLGEFTSSLPARFQELTSDYASGNWQSLSNRAHNLKGLSASFGAARLSQNALELEKHIEAGWYAKAEGKLNEIGDSIHSLISKSMELLSRPSSDEYQD